MSTKRKLILGRKRVQHHRAVKRARLQDAFDVSSSDDEPTDFQTPHTGHQVLPECEHSEDSGGADGVDTSKGDHNLTSSSHDSAALRRLYIVLYVGPIVLYKVEPKTSEQVG